MHTQRTINPTITRCPHCGWYVPPSLIKEGEGRPLIHCYQHKAWGLRQVQAVTVQVG